MRWQDRKKDTEIYCYKCKKMTLQAWRYDKSTRDCYQSSVGRGGADWRWHQCLECGKITLSDFFTD